MSLSLDAVDVEIERDISGARAAIVELAGQSPDRWWTAHELKVQARRHWSSGVMGLAMRRLIGEGHFEQRRDLRLRPQPLPKPAVAGSPRS
jgi:hypothetical protein